VGHEDLAKVDAAVRDRIDRDGSADILVLMGEQADLTAAYSIEDWDARGRYVLDTLQEVAKRSQAPVVAFAKSRGLAYRSFFSTNALYLPGSNWRAVRSLASLPEVASVRLADSQRLLPEEETERLTESGLGYGWNLDLLDPQPNPSEGAYGMQAVQVWDSYSIRGEGIVVASIDTGVRFTHEALVRQYRGNLGGGQFNHDFNWYQPTPGCGDGSFPCDNHDPGHGTKATGIMIGENISLTEQVGVAPAADWIACAGCESDDCSDIALLACADWILAPCRIGDDPGEPGCDPEKRPYVVNNSWGGDEGGDMWFLSFVSAWRAAGIFPTFSAGNKTVCKALSSPGDYLESFASAAHGSLGFNWYAGGPSTALGAEGAVKPNLNAPTNGRTSAAESDTTYYNLDGTSGASPHTAGAVALCWSANTDLIGDVETTFELLHQTARDTLTTGDCGEVPSVPPSSVDRIFTPNYEYGWGYLDALALVEACTSGQLVGHVYDASDNSPIAGATLAVAGGVKSDASGAYSVTLEVGTYDVTAGATGYYSVTETGLTISPGATLVQDFSLPLGWSVAPTTPFQLTSFDAVFVPGPEDELWANKVYFPGGLEGESGVESADVWVYNPYTGVYSDTGADLGQGVSYYSADLITGGNGECDGPAIYIIGGYNNETLADQVQWYCVHTGTTGTGDPWHPVVSPTVTYLPGGTAVVDDLIYVFGGWQQGDPQDFRDWTWRYDPVTDYWEKLEPALSVPRAFIGTAVVGSRMFALGGVSGYVSDPEDMIPTDVVEMLDTENLAAGWQTVAPMPVPTAEGRAFGFDADILHGLGIHATTGRVIYVGGGDWPDRSAKVWVYDLLRDNWDTFFPNLHQARRDHAAAYIPLCSSPRYDGLPGMWVWGGDEDPPYGDPEFHSFLCYTDFAYLPLVMRQ
jgi:hypothetical protein